MLILSLWIAITSVSMGIVSLSRNPCVSLDADMESAVR
jgi:hypothetical protein